MGRYGLYATMVPWDRNSDSQGFRHYTVPKYYKIPCYSSLESYTFGTIKLGLKVADTGYYLSDQRL